MSRDKDDALSTPSRKRTSGILSYGSSSQRRVRMRSTMDNPCRVGLRYALQCGSGSSRLSSKFILFTFQVWLGVIILECFPWNISSTRKLTKGLCKRDHNLDFMVFHIYCFNSFWMFIIVSILHFEIHVLLCHLSNIPWEHINQLLKNEQTCRSFIIFLSYVRLYCTQ